MVKKPMVSLYGIVMGNDHPMPWNIWPRNSGKQKQRFSVEGL